MNRPRGWVCPRNRRSSEIPAQFLHQRADSRNLKCKRKLSSGRVWCAHRYRRIPAQQSSTLRRLVAERVFSTFRACTFFRKSALEGDSDRLLDFALWIRAYSRYFLGIELLRSSADHLRQKLCNIKSRPPPRPINPVIRFIYTTARHRSLCLILKVPRSYTGI